MGNGMNKIVEGVYVGNFRDAKDPEQLEKNGITHILSIHDHAKEIIKDKKYLCIIASDNAQQDLTQFFSQCNDFIHTARLADGRVLVHCLAGVSRSVTITAAYLMSAVGLDWRQALNCIRGARNAASPNYGFQQQLQHFQYGGLDKERERLRTSHPPSPYDDAGECEILLKSFRNFVLHGNSNNDDGLYALPHNAYRSGERSGNQSSASTQGTSPGNDSAENVVNGAKD